MKYYDKRSSEKRADERSNEEHSDERFSEKRMKCKRKALTLARRTTIHCFGDNTALRRCLRSEMMRFEMVEVVFEEDERRDPSEVRDHRP